MKGYELHSKQEQDVSHTMNRHGLLNHHFTNRIAFDVYQSLPVYPGSHIHTSKSGSKQPCLEHDTVDMQSIRNEVSYPKLMMPTPFTGP
jgi:hypothetical protein